MNQVAENPAKNCGGENAPKSGANDANPLACKKSRSFFRKRMNRIDWLMALAGAYCVISVMMNLLCMKPLSFGTGFIWMDGGLIVSWIVFMISNVITEVYGKRRAIVVAGIATVVAFFVSIVAVVEVRIPTLPEYAEQAEHFANIFSNGPRTIVSSAIAFFIGNVINVEIIDRFRKRAVACNNDSAIRFTFRAVISTIVGQFADNMLFQGLAFAPLGISLYEMRWVDISPAVVTSTFIETTVEAFFIGFVTIPLTKYLKRMN